MCMNRSNNANCSRCVNVSNYNRTKYRCKLGLVSEGKKFPVTRAKAEVDCDKFDHYRNHEGPGVPLNLIIGGE